MTKSIKYHLANWKSGKTYCGLNFKTDSIRLAIKDDGDWIDDCGDELQLDKPFDVFCLNCLKLYESNLIEELKQKTFLIEYKLRMPKSIRGKRKRNASIRSNRIKGIKTDSLSNELDKKFSPPKSDKGKARQKRKAQSKSKSIIKTNPIERAIGLFPAPVTESKCKVISKPKPKKKKESKPIEKKPLLNKGDKIEVIEEVPIEDSFRIGDPIEDDVLEMGIGTNWKLVRHDKHLDMWKLQTKSINKKNKVSKWIDDTEYCPYEFISEIINSGYCE